MKIPPHALRQILRFIPEISVSEWLSTPNLIFNWSRPEDVINNGGYLQIVKLADELNSPDILVVLNKTN
jgi:hypothetical protein